MEKQETKKSSEITRSGATEFSSDASSSAQNLKSENGGENAVLIKSPATVNLLDAKIVKSGSAENANAGLYGTNAAILVYDGATLNMTSGSINANAAYTSGIFAYGSDNKISVKDTKITTLGKNSSGIAVVGSANIKLKSVKFENDGKVFLKVQGEKQGVSNAIVKMDDQHAEGDILVDKMSSLGLTLTNGSYYKGALNADNEAKNIDLEVSENSVVVLTADAYITTLINGNKTNENIYANGYKLYINKKETEINQSRNIPETTAAIKEGTQTTQGTKCDTKGGCSSNNMGWIAWVAGGVALAAIIAIVVIMVMGRKKKVLLEDEPKENVPGNSTF